ncbi:TPA: hypothetical protein ACH3X1_004354 [Trebouxia sp. C0004]
MFTDGDEKQAKRLDDLVGRALLKDLQGQGNHFALELPEIDLEATVLNRLAVLEVLCKSQAQTISILQSENSSLNSSLAASTSNSKGHQQEHASTEESLHPSFVPFKGSSHTLEESCAGFKPFNAAFIPARHHPRSSQQALLPSLVHTLSSHASPLRPLQREEFLAKLPKVVVKGGQLLPIRSCIEAFLMGDDAALQSTMGPSSAELQQMLARIVWAADANCAANSAAAFSAAGAASSTAAQASCNTNSASSASTAGHVCADCDPDCSSSSNVSTGSEAQVAEGTPEAALKAPATASTSRAEMSSQNYLAAGSSGPGGAAALIDHEEEAGCDVLVKYLLREFLGGDQTTQL